MTPTSHEPNNAPTSDPLLVTSRGLWSQVPSPDRTLATRPPRVGAPISAADLDGLLRRGRSRSLAALWPSLTDDQRAAAVHAGTPSVHSCATDRPTSDRPDGDTSTDWLLALAVTDRLAWMLRSTCLSARQWTALWHAPASLLPHDLADTSAAQWMTAAVDGPGHRDDLRRAALASPCVPHLPLDLVLAMARPWTPDSAHAVARHPQAPPRVLRRLTTMPGLRPATRARLIAHPALPADTVSEMLQVDTDRTLVSLREVSVSPHRLAELLEHPLPPRVVGELVHHQPAVDVLLGTMTASEAALTLLFRKHHVATQPELVERALASPYPGARAALAQVVTDERALVALASDEDARVRTVASQRVVTALLGGLDTTADEAA